MSVQRYAQLGAAAGYLDATRPLPDAAELVARLAATPTTADAVNGRASRTVSVYHGGKRIAEIAVRSQPFCVYDSRRNACSFSPPFTYSPHRTYSVGPFHCTSPPKNSSGFN